MKKVLKKEFQVKSVSLSGKNVEIVWQDNCKSSFDLNWLQMSTRSSKKFSADSYEYTDCPIYNTFQEVAVDKVQLSNNKILIDLGSGIEEIDASWLRAQDATVSYSLPAFEDKVQWSNSFSILEHSYDEAIESNQWISDLDKFGIVTIKGVSPDDLEEKLDKITKKVGVLRRRFHPTDINVIEPKPNNISLDKAYTGGTLEYHTDAPYYDLPPKIAFLACKKLEGEPPINYFCDGFKAASELKETHKEAYNILSTYLVNLARRRLRSHQEDSSIEHSLYSWDTQTLTKIIVTNGFGEPEIIRIHSRSFSGFPSDYSGIQIKKFIEAYGGFLDLIKQDRFNVQMKLEPGNIVIIDNHRLVHARSKIQGNTARMIYSCYIDEYIWNSRLRFLLGERAEMDDVWLRGCTIDQVKILANRWE
ncbi:TauD/TfdA family dioxygenase [Moorena producens JHB]|uniref:TauD/TfdA family dioxygenase n=1 Tax=Moorena producens (strain JHB) TaxID=1454205 RepID=A0A1D9G9E7_MOOP1|nr:TauD/TfdA family dioxygenase [Moorena producens]AOY84269.1 TauD/TfdA family dioxygenase [Moorena producens JHB]